MKRWRNRFSVGLTALLATGSCHAANYQVSVNDDYFDPQALTIYAGDSITFTNVSTMGPMNVRALNNSFRCAVGCLGDGSGATGNPSSAAWSDTLTFSNPGDISYVSDQRVVEGEKNGATGTIHVSVAASGPAIKPGISGNWFNPSANQGGHGLQIEVLPDNGLLVIWFVFGPEGQQNWIYSQGAYDPASNSAVLPAYVEEGGFFPPRFNETNVTVMSWGLLRLTFTDCDNGTADWTPNTAVAQMGYEATSFPIRRLTRIAGTSCQ
jgi:plastocyanin